MRDPWLRGAVLFALAIVAVSCKGDTTKQADPASAAGDVLEVTGAVSTTRDGATHPLAVGDTVAAGDRVTTGADGDVVIELRHNHVRWHLGPEQARTPMEAAAWSAPPPMAVSEVSGDRTAVAGRHAEREAAQTTAGAVASPPVAGPPVGNVEVQEKRGHKRKAEKEAPPEPTVEPPPGKGGGGTFSGSGSDGGDLGIGGIGGVASEMPETLGRDEVADGIAKVHDRFEACGEKYPEGPDHVKLKVKVSSSGAVTSAHVDDDTIDDGLASCLESAVKSAKFAVTQKGGTFTYPAQLR